jgi:hypothetical protein
MMCSKHKCIKINVYRRLYSGQQTIREAMQWHHERHFLSPSIAPLQPRTSRRDESTSMACRGLGDRLEIVKGTAYLEGSSSRRIREPAVDWLPSERSLIGCERAEGACRLIAYERAAQVNLSGIHTKFKEIEVKDGNLECR